MNAILVAAIAAASVVAGLFFLFFTLSFLFAILDKNRAGHGR